MKWFTRALGAAALGLAVVASASAADKADKKSAFEVDVVRDVAYTSDADARQKLDLYLPRGQKDFPVLLFLHGGGYTKGDRKDLEALGETLARQGVGVAAAGYRLAPQVTHPGQVQDAARAFAWLQKNVGKHGGRADRLFVGGHSAGAQLAALLASDERYLKAEGAGLKDVAGVIALSGPYRLPEARKDVFGDEEQRKQASPITHVKEGLPPFFLAFAEKDAPGGDALTREFAEALKGKKVEAEVFEAKDRDHGSLLTKIQDGDATAAAAIAFIARHDGEGRGRTEKK